MITLLAGLLQLLKSVRRDGLAQGFPQPTERGKNSDAGNRRPLWILALLVFVALAWATKQQKLSVASFSSIGRDSKRTARGYDSKIDWYLKEVNQKKQLNAAKVEVDNFYSAPELDNQTAPVGRVENTEAMTNYGVSMDQDSSAEQVYQQIEADDAVAPPDSPDDFINRRLIAQRMQQEMSQQERKQYIRQFLANARKAGYDITLDSNLRVRRVRKINQYKIFNPDE